VTDQEQLDRLLQILSPLREATNHLGLRIHQAASLILTSHDPANTATLKAVGSTLEGLAVDLDIQQRRMATILAALERDQLEPA
jgi:hypothetical protein